MYKHRCTQIKNPCASALHPWLFFLKRRSIGMRNALLVLVIMLGIVATGAGVAEFVLVVSVVIAIVVMLLVNHDGRLLLDDDRASLDHDGPIDDHFVAPLDDHGAGHDHIDDGA